MRIILWDYLEDAERVMVAGALATRSHKVAADLEVTDEQIVKMLKWTKEMKLSSVLDFGYYIVSIEGVSRSFTHQWVRYRIAAHMQQSLRYVKVDTGSTDWFVIPPEIVKKGPDLVVQYIRSALRSGEMYLELINRGVPPEDARFVLPIGVKTHISSAFDPEELIHIIYQRTCFDAQWEIRTVAYSLLLAGLIVHPRIFEGVGPACLFIGEEKCRGSRKGVCREDAKNIIEALKKIANEYRKKFENVPPSEFLRIDLTDVLGYRAPRDIVIEVSRRLGFRVNLDLDVILEVRKK